MRMKMFLKDCIPPIVLRGLKKLLGKRTDNAWRGDYLDWASAVADSTGYDSDEIFHKVREAARNVRDGKALWDRDSVCFYHEEYNYPLLTALLHTAARQGGKLHVLDFGGALGSTYQQHKKFLDDIPDFSWNIVEQAHVVDCGRQEFENDSLHFFYSIEEAFAQASINIAIFSCVLQYMKKPYAVLQNVLDLSPFSIYVCRTPLIDIEKIVIQQVSDKIFSALLPMRILSKEKLLNILENHMQRFSFMRILYSGRDEIDKGLFCHIYLSNVSKIY